MIRFVLAFILLVLAPAAACAQEHIPLILISIDGFRAEYAKRGKTPVLSQLAKEGATASDGMKPSFPVLTYPNHYTLVTGLRPDHHGIVDNVMTDPAIPGVTFTLSDRKTVEDEKWWGQAEPLWATAERQGLLAAPLDWPGSETTRYGRHPAYWRKFDPKRPNAQRVDDILSLLGQPVGKRPGFLTLYFDSVDEAGHKYGPNSPEVNAAIAEVDAAIGRLVQGLKDKGLYDKVNIVVVSDHGMAEVDMKRRVAAEDWVSPDVATLVNSAAVVGFVPKPGKEAEAKKALLGKHPTGQCWEKDKIPERLHYGTNPRVPPIVCLSDRGAYVVRKADEAKRTTEPDHGSHGYDPDDPEMRALFIARGPDIKPGSNISSFDNVDLQPFLAKILVIEAPRSDGNPKTLERILRR